MLEKTLPAHAFTFPSAAAADENEKTAHGLLLGPGIGQYIAAVVPAKIK